MVTATLSDRSEGRQQDKDLGYCLCGACLGPQTDGDVTMCTKCYQWHHAFEANGEIAILPIGKKEAWRLALAPMDPWDLLEIMDQAAQAMRPEYVGLGRGKW